VLGGCVSDGWDGRGGRVIGSVPKQFISTIFMNTARPIATFSLLTSAPILAPLVPVHLLADALAAAAALLSALSTTPDASRCSGVMRAAGSSLK
jgi:hypothetical protein